MTGKERKVGHDALRVKNGKIEHFDPHPLNIEEQDEEEFEEWWYGLHPGWEPTVFWKDRYICAKDSWLASRRLLRQQRAFKIADSFPCATIDESDEERENKNG